tara:strand:- start:361 stop:1422 length:1062 start_codon:yes stop_codon:yes gene_type:complete
MPHDLSITSNGDAEMMYVGETPWHGLGTKLDNPATSQEAIAAAQLEWSVEKQPLYRRQTDNSFSLLDNSFSLVRNDNGVVLNRFVTDKYEIVQNTDAFQFFDDLIGQGQAIYDTAGALRDGRVVWILAKLPESVEVVRGDVIDKYILLSTSHDGSQSLQISTTPIRVVCANTLRFGLQRAKHSMRMKHTASIHDRVVEARQALDLSDAYFALMMEGIEVLTNTSMDSGDVRRFSDALFRINPADDRVHVYSDNARTAVFDLFYTGRGQDIKGVRDTAYAALNATTEYLDNIAHVQLYDASQYSQQAQDARLYKTWFGRSQDVRTRAWNLLQDFSFNGSQAFEYTPRPQLAGVR